MEVTSLDLLELEDGTTVHHGRWVDLPTWDLTSHSQVYWGLLLTLSTETFPISTLFLIIPVLVAIRRSSADHIDRLGNTDAIRRRRARGTG